MPKYILIRYWFQKPKDDPRYANDKSGWRWVFATKDEAVKIVGNKMLSNAEFCYE